MPAVRHGEERVRLLCEYWQLRPPSQVLQALCTLEKVSSLQLAQECLWRDCILHPVSSGGVSSFEHQRQLLKAVSLASEKRGEELSEKLAELHAGLLLQHAEPETGWHTRAYAYSCAEQACGQALLTPGLQPCALMPGLQCSLSHVTHPGVITLRSSCNLLAGSTGCHVWQASFGLAQYILSHAEQFQGRSCLELGCGAGLVSICLHRVGASSVVATDGDATAISNCCHNLTSNSIPYQEWEAGSWSAAPLQRQCVRPPQWIAQPATCCTSASCDLEPLILAECKLLGKRMCVCQTIHVSQYQWADPCPWRPELVLGADLLYDPGGINDLVSLLVRMLSRHHKSDSHRPQAILAATVRNDATFMAFLTAAEGHGLSVEEVSNRMRSPGRGLDFLHLPVDLAAESVKLLSVKFPSS